MSFNQRIWLEEEEKLELSKILEELFLDNDLPTDNIYIGGFSSGGNVSLLIGYYLIGTQSKISPIGLFAVDSPIDILALYKNARKNIARNLVQASVQESEMIVSMVEDSFSQLKDTLDDFEEYSVYTNKTGNTENISNLRGAKIRLYTEPDALWWKENRGYDYEETNSYSFEQLYRVLKNRPGYEVTYIATDDRGYRSNGERHPHSWSIVDVENLVEWM